MKHDCEREKNKKLIYNNLTLNKNVTCFSILSQKVLDESEYNEEHYSRRQKIILNLNSNTSEYNLTSTRKE